MNASATGERHSLTVKFKGRETLECGHLTEEANATRKGSGEHCYDSLQETVKTQIHSKYNLKLLSTRSYVCNTMDNCKGAIFTQTGITITFDCR
jgi:hypothetical protein